MRSLFLHLFTTLSLLGLIVAGCGKKPKTGNNQQETIREPVTPDEAFLEKQDVSCESNQACPNYLAKVVIRTGNGYNFCTGFLTDENILATSTSCLPRFIRLSGQNCSKDVFVYFPKTSNRPFERVGCVQVRQVSDLEGDDPILWRDDISFLELNKSLPYRRSGQISREGLLNSRSYTTWMVDQHDEYSAIVRKYNCNAIHNTYVNPLALNESSPSVVLADCIVPHGGSGAPVIDSRGKVRAVVSKGMDPKLRNFLESTGLLTRGLKDMFHATNFACAPTPDNDEVLDEKECRKNLSIYEADRVRHEMLSTNFVIGKLKREYEDYVNAQSKYVQLGVKLIAKDDTSGVYTTEIYPKCFRPFADWVPSLNSVRNNYTDKIRVPIRSFKKVMDAYARPEGIPTNTPEKTLNIKFSMKDVRSDRRSTVSLRFPEETRDRNFSGITDVCSNEQLLF